MFLIESTNVCFWGVATCTVCIWLLFTELYSFLSVWQKARGVTIKSKRVFGGGFLMSDRETRIAGSAFGDLAIADVFESVAYWLRADRNTLDALSHACAATRRHIARSPHFADLVLICPRGCHVRCCTPRKRLAAQRIKFVAVWRLRSACTTCKYSV